MAIRTEQTLRRMWEESIKLAGDANKLGEEYRTAAAQADEHYRAAAAETAAADACRANAEAARNVGERAEAEAADLADLVNRERQDAGLELLKPGEPYPTDPKDPAVTRTEGEVAQP